MAWSDADLRHAFQLRRCIMCRVAPVAWWPRRLARRLHGRAHAPGGGIGCYQDSCTLPDGVAAVRRLCRRLGGGAEEVAARAGGREGWGGRLTNWLWAAWKEGEAAGRGALLADAISRLQRGRRDGSSIPPHPSLLPSHQLATNYWGV